MKRLVCPKCNGINIMVIKDILHSNGGGNISTSKIFFSESNTALVTFYVCSDCGYVEQYLDSEELQKLKTKYKKGEKINFKK